MDILALIQARMGSTRLPSKVLMDLEGVPVLEHVVTRVSASKNISEVVVVTTIEKIDMAIVKFCAEKGIRVFCGSESDVLDRFYQCAKLLKPKHIVRITADCPLIDASIIDSVITKHLEDHSDYASNVLTETYPDGEDVEIISFAALKKAWCEARLLSEREHVTPYIRNHPELFHISELKSPINYNHFRWTLDTDSDYIMIREIYHALYLNKPLFGMEDILNFIKQHPEIEKLNKNIERNEGFHKSLKEDKIIDISEES